MRLMRKLGRGLRRIFRRTSIRYPLTSLGLTARVLNIRRRSCLWKETNQGISDDKLTSAYQARFNECFGDFALVEITVEEKCVYKGPIRHEAGDSGSACSDRQFLTVPGCHSPVHGTDPCKSIRLKQACGDAGTISASADCDDVCIIPDFLHPLLQLA